MYSIYRRELCHGYLEKSLIRNLREYRRGLYTGLPERDLLTNNKNMKTTCKECKKVIVEEVVDNQGVRISHPDIELICVECAKSKHTL